MIEQIVIDMIRTLVVLLFMIVFHEFGHLIVFKIHKIPYKFTFNKEHVGFDFYTEDKDLRFWIYFVAILLGFFPAIFIGFPSIYFELLAIGAYLYGCAFDFQQLKRWWKEC